MLMAAFAAGCASLSSAPPEEVVRERAQARWDALRAGEWAKAYGYMAPSFRAVVDEKRYPSRFGGGVAWVGAEVVQVTCQEERCIARVRIDAKPILGGRPGEVMSTHYDETWVREDRQWWLYERL